MAFFGFIPSESLLNKIQTAIAQKDSKEPLYPLRDEIALQVNDEIIDAIVTNLIHRFPEHYHWSYKRFKANPELRNLYNLPHEQAMQLVTKVRTQQLDPND